MYHNKLARRTENSKIWQKSKTTDENIFYSLYSLYQHTFKHKIVKKKSNKNKSSAGFESKTIHYYTCTKDTKHILSCKLLKMS